MKHSMILALLLIACSPSRQAAEHGRHIDVVSIEKEVDKSSPGYELCNSFTLTKENVATYFSTADEVNEYEFGDEAIIFPCNYHGSIKIDGHLLQWKIFPAGAGYLYSESVNKRYLCKKDCRDALPNLC